MEQNNEYTPISKETVQKIIDKFNHADNGNKSLFANHYGLMVDGVMYGIEYDLDVDVQVYRRKNIEQNIRYGQLVTYDVDYSIDFYYDAFVSLPITKTILKEPPFVIVTYGDLKHEN
jgi:hypothetical protein